jgi:hypothetical protein
MREQWSRIVELAFQIERDHAAGLAVDERAATSLARLVLDFQVALIHAVLRATDAPLGKRRARSVA